MVAKFAVLGLYVLAVFIIAYFARRKSSSAEDYYLAGRNLSPLILLATIAATNFMIDGTPIAEVSPSNAFNA